MLETLKSKRIREEYFKSKERLKRERTNKRQMSLLNKLHNKLP